MKRYRKYRLTFDLAGLLGLLLLFLYFWYAHPTPQWRVPLEPNNSSALGFSSDNQKVYSIKNTDGNGNSVPKPILQRWEITTGKLDAEYPLQMPADDVTLLKPFLAKPTPCLDYRVHLVHENMLYVETPVGTRFYDVQSGRCLSQRNMQGGWIDYLMQNPADQHYWGLADIFNPEFGGAVLYDLTTGKVLHAIKHELSQGLYGSKLSSDQKCLLLLWRKKTEESNLWTYELEILEVGTWKRILKKPAQEPGGYGVGPLLPNSLLIQTSYFKENDLSMERLEFSRLDQATGTLEPDNNHVFHGFVSSDLIFVRNEYMILQGIRGKHQEILPRWKVVWNFFANLIRHGQFPEPPGSQDYRVYDFNTGRQLRQLTGLTAFGHQSLFLSQDARFLLGKEYLGERNKASQPEQAFLTLYEIPHYWWEKSWSVTLYLALILLFLWPARFLGRKPI